MPRRLVFRAHALQRLFERAIGVSEVRAVLETGEVIARYEGDRPYASRLVLGWREGGPLHVVVADGPRSDITFVITVYEPDPDLWSPDFRSRR